MYELALIENSGSGEKLCDSDVSTSLDELTVTTMAKHLFHGTSFSFRSFIVGT
jgi:hypothetical protein